MKDWKKRLEEAHGPELKKVLNEIVEDCKNYGKRPFWVNCLVFCFYNLPGLVTGILIGMFFLRK
jgi:hypothetical protein